MSSQRFRVVFSALLFAVACPTTEAQVVIGQNFWDVNWGSGTADPFAAGRSNVSGDNPWKAGFADECGPYNILRFMDWNRTNTHYSHVPDSLWSSRPQKSDRDQSVVAYEWQIDICNRSNSHMWVCVPYKASSTYMYNLATLIKDNLDSSLRVIVEWGNEVWNPGFPVHTYCAEQAKKIDPSYPWTVYYLQETSETFYQFERVFGADNPRLVRVLSGWAAQPALTRQLLGIMTASPLKATINPHDVRPDAFAIATYFAATKASDISTKSDWLQHKSYVDEFGVPLAYYEGGSGDTDNPFANALLTVYADHIADLNDVGFLFGCHYYHSGARPWASIPRNGIGYAEAVNYPKYKVLTDYALVNRFPPVDEPIVGVSRAQPKASSARQTYGTNTAAARYTLTGKRLSRIGRARSAGIITVERLPNGATQMVTNENARQR